MKTATMHRDTRARQHRNAPAGSRAATILAIGAVIIATLSAAACSSPMEPVCLNPASPDSTGAYYVAVHPAHWPHIDACPDTPHAEP